MYAAKHNYTSLADDAAFLTLDCSPIKLTLRAKEYKLSETLIVKWVHSVP
jgi:hypothetical protein